MSKKRGRPKKAIGQAKSKPIQIRAEPLEKTGFESAATLAGVSLSSWCRERLRTAARKELQEAGELVPFLPSNMPKK